MIHPLKLNMKERMDFEAGGLKTKNINFITQLFHLDGSFKN